MTGLAILEPNAVAQQLIGRDYLSYSSVSLYQRCPLAFRFRYVDELPEPFVSSSLAFGAAIHAAIEHHFRQLMAGHDLLDVDEMLSEFWDSWSSREPQTIEFGKGEDINSIGELAEKLLRTFQLSDSCHSDGAVIGVEEPLRRPLTADLPDFLARLDLLVESDTELILSDFKTARTKWSQEHAENAADQLLLYGELVRDMLPDKPVRLQFIVLTKTKTPSVERFEVQNDPRRIHRTKRTVEHVWRAIEGHHFYPSPSPINCGSCPYRRPCRHWPN